MVMDARAVTVMRCSECHLDQPVAEYCANCYVKVANYYCDVCKLFDDSDSPTYHCPYCNICRRGFGLGVDHMHCMECNLCVGLDYINDHPCGPAARAQAGLVDDPVTDGLSDG